jgi:hypothetical protein
MSEANQHSMHAATTTQETKAYLKNLKQIHAGLFVQYALEILGQIDMSQHEVAWCSICQGFCRVCPPPAPRTFYLEVAGSVCKPYSTMNAESWGLLDANALPMLVWAFWCKHCRFNAVVHECVLNFPLNIADQILTAGLMGAQSAGAYSPAASVENNPYDFGVPKRRPRQYARWLRHVADAGTDFKSTPVPEAASPAAAEEWTRGDCKPVHLHVEFNQRWMAQLFYRQLMLDASIYLVADAQMVQAYYTARASQRNLQLTPAESAGLVPLSVEDVIPICARVHLEAYRETFENMLGKSGSTDDSSNAGPGLVCLMQSPHHIKPTFGRCAPPLLTGSLPYSLKYNRLVLPEELLLLQGIPSSELVPKAPVQSPWPHPLSTVVSDHELRRLLGNGMDVSQVGAALALILLEALGL